MPNLNVPLAEKVLRSILTYPDKHDQNSWFELDDFETVPEADEPIEREEFDGEVTETRVITVKGMLEGSCETTACVAGWAALHAGWSVRTTRIEGYGEIEQYAISPTGEEVGFGRSIDFQEQGQEALNLDDGDASKLFFDTTDETAPVYLFGLLKGIERPNLLKVADHLEIPYELPDYLVEEYVNVKDNDVNEDDLPFEDYVRVRNEVLHKILSEYPPYTPQELASS